MAEQLEHLIKMSERPNIVIQVMPESEGTTAAGGRSFTVLPLRRNQRSCILKICKAPVTSASPTRCHDTLTFDYLRSSALNDEKSRALMQEVKNSYAMA
jgi:Domain of unknown function (DUF5753)